MTRTAVCFLSLLSVAIAAFAQSTAPTTAPATAPAADIGNLVTALGDADWQTRAKAQDQLVALGTDIVPEVKAALERASDPEVKTALKSVLTRIAEEKRSGPTPVTLHFDNAPALSVLDALRQQTGYKLPLWPEDLW